jgi:hypothetical protein
MMVRCLPEQSDATREADGIAESKVPHMHHTVGWR